ncbi:hypothetical protein GLN3_08720 [Geobacillus lituanicus]|nr:hypothetical protein GLN3_08720 [Geobacillus lituanicus]
MAKPLWARPFLYMLALAMSAFFLLPVYVMIVTSLKPLDEVTLADMWKLPSTVDWSSYATAFEKLAPNFWNSILLAALPTLLVYIFLGKYFVRGLLAGSVKG